MNTQTNVNASPLFLSQRASYAQDKRAARFSEFGGVNTYDVRVQRARDAECRARAQAAARSTVIGSLLYALGLI